MGLFIGIKQQMLFLFSYHFAQFNENTPIYRKTTFTIFAKRNIMGIKSYRMSTTKYSWMNEDATSLCITIR